MKAAIYARFSTDLQREQSIEDQFRVAERLAEREGFKVIVKFSDAAISGGTAQRPGYQKLLAAARRREFDVIVAEDTSRLWRNLAEQAPRLAELSDLGIAVVTHDLDTRHESAEIMGAVGGAMASAYRREIGRRTRRGLEGLARAGKPAGGRAYGYIPAALSATGQIEIDPEQAEVVRRIFTLYVDGHSPRSIAETLNRDGVPSPGSTWNRQSRRSRGWVGSAISSTPARGLGILNNDVYRGVVIWNRVRNVRSAADSSKRRQVLNPRKEWIIRQEERLRIIPDDLWNAVKARQGAQIERIGERIKGGLSKAAASRTGAGPKYLVSGLLRCGHCGSAYVIAGRGIYKCSGYTNGGIALCSNDVPLHRKVAEAEVLAGIKRDLCSPEVIKEIVRRVRVTLRSRKPKAQDHSARIARLQGEIENLADAVASGALRASPTLAARLTAAEGELERLTAAQRGPSRGSDVTPLLSDLAGRAAKAVDNLEETLSAGDVPRAREQLRAHLGTVTVETDDREIRLYSDQRAMTTALLRTGTKAYGNASLYGAEERT